MSASLKETLRVMRQDRKLFSEQNGKLNMKLATANAEIARLTAENAGLRDVLNELVGAVTSKGAPDAREPIMWSGSPTQNRRMYAAINAARKNGGRVS